MIFRIDEETPLPDRIDALTAGERLLLCAFRRWVAGLRDSDIRQWERTWSDFCFEFGSHAGREATTAISTLVGAIREGARRRIRHHEPCCPFLTADEITIAGLVAAAQRADLFTARSLAVWLVRGDSSGTLLAAAGALADRMRETGIILPDRRHRPAPVPARGPTVREAVTEASARLRVVV
ncbi:hypothetical protein [Arenibaculum pallidiluteum]|uniref:hypothetical protein n=1 Tax=Arenibaculum pallidiluteum TaxID=2812559 RepID=UPI001A95C7CB|nr:hypothetical protein [Arenibaculum pallidiluteum]